ncbi:hypothetical protein MKZ38_005115 [Zalerion maritima]|uniref:F-box domain-containing protein n=1 Tax=Zalerion maritima TaxID=339359 RepID=A0AAD5RLQ3_9PEZI|nr:hypothetical protein MKZ38_005115 [Zalerion maritima]
MSSEPPHRLSPATDAKASALRPLSRSSQKVSLHWDDVDNGISKETSTSMQFGLAECVETKTITTTTTTKRTFPRLFVRQARPLHSLDQKEYPLAHKATPDELKNISWNMANYMSKQSQEEGSEFDEDDSMMNDIKAEPASDMTPQDSPTRPYRNSSLLSRSKVQKARRPSKINLPHAVADRLRRSGRPAAASNLFPTTPDTTDLSLSRVVNDLDDSFSDVPTPPVERCPEPFASDESSSQESIPARNTSRINTVAAQSDTLPSPGLSPTLAATEMPGEVVPWEEEDSQDLSLSRPGIQSMLQNFDQMPDELQGVMVYHMLRRCPRPILRMVADVVNPALKCDFVKELPNELSLMVLSHLDHKDLCRAAQVSKYWRSMIDANETGWKELMDRDGLELPPGELEKAIQQGWGWQDPEGYYGCERDLRPQARLTMPEKQLHAREALVVSKRTGGPQLRSSKRKRANHAAFERSKRRASGNQSSSPSSSLKHKTNADKHRAEGPIAHATAAALAVPKPDLGLPSLSKLHLYKSLYRRQRMIRESWTNKKVKPSHVAFAAHPRHVITCLQFDDDKIISGSDDTFIHVYDTKTGELRKRLEGHDGGVWALHYVGNTLVSGSTDRTVRVWDIERGLCTHVLHGHTSTVRCLQILMPTEVEENGRKVMRPQYPIIITGSRDSQLRVWRLPETTNLPASSLPIDEPDSQYFIRVLAGHTHSVRAIAAHGDTLVSGSYDSTVRVWKITTGENFHVLNGHQQKVYSVVLDHKRNRCISGSMDSNVKIWDLSTGNCLHTLEGHTLLVGLLDLQEERLVSAAADSTLRIWDPENGRCRNILSAHTGAITCFQHDARKVISGSEKTVKMWDIQTGECVQDLLTDLTGVWQVSFDNRRCVAAVQRNSLTYLEILDFGAARDGKPEAELGNRVLLNPGEVERVERTMSEEEA